MLPLGSQTNSLDQNNNELSKYDKIRSLSDYPDYCGPDWYRTGECGRKIAKRF